jgi:hypothetical protein
VFFFILALAAACGGAGDDGPGNNDPEVIVNEDVMVLDATARQALATFELDTTLNEGEIRFDASNPFAQSVEVGRILAAQPVDGIAPYGFLQRVESKRVEQDQIVLGTSQATLLETFDQADINFEQRLVPDDIADLQTAQQGVSIRTSQSALTRQQALGFDFGVDFDKVLIDADGDSSTTNDQLTLSGELMFNANARAKIDIGFLADLDEFLFELSFDEQADLQLDGQLGRTFNETIDIANYQFATFTIFVGPVPVVFSVTLDLDAGADGELRISFQTSAVQQANMRLGARYTDGGGWRTINDFDSSFTFTEPTLEGAASIYGYVEPRVAVRIYGLAGPFVSAAAFVEADAELYRTPFWQLAAGLDLGIGFEIVLPVIGEVARFEKTFRLLEEELASAPNRRPDLDVLKPTDGARLTDGDQVRFELDVSDREQQEVDVVITDGSGNVVAERRVDDQSTAALFSSGLCVGSHTFQITATDDDGESTSETISVIVDNRTPTVTVDRGTAPSPFPGGYLVAFADASDRTCDSPNAAEPALIGWYADGQRIGSTDELLFRVPTSDYGPGDTLTLQARYDDGADVGESTAEQISVIQKPAGLDIEPMAIIRKPVDGNGYETNNGEVAFEGIGIDTEDGELNTLVWEIRTGVNQWTEISRDRTGFIDHFTLFPGSGFGFYDLRLTVTDSAGQSVTETVSYNTFPSG